MKLVLLGAPGAGKGTQAALLHKEYGIPQISTGEILRESLRAGTPIGLQAKAYMDKGALVPDDVIIGIVRERLAQPDCSRGFMLDGFPRTVAQGSALEGITRLDRVVYYEVGDEVLVERLALRRTCRGCDATYHLASLPPQVEGRCDKCSGELYQRSDDNETAVRNRLRTFHEQTAPLIEFYSKKVLLARVPVALADRPEDILRKARAALEG